MFSQNLATLSKKRHVLVLLDVLQMAGGCAPANPSAHFFGQRLSKQLFARLSKKQRFAIRFDVLQMGGGCTPPNPPLIFVAPHSQARPSSAEQETTCFRKTSQRAARSDMFSSFFKCFANGRGLRPLQPPGSFFWAASEETNFCKT